MCRAGSVVNGASAGWSGLPGRARVFQEVGRKGLLGSAQASSPRPAALSRPWRHTQYVEGSCLGGPPSLPGWDPPEVGLCPGPPARGPPACRHWLCWAPAGHAPARAMATRGTSPAGWADLARSYLQGWPRSQTVHVCENRSRPARDTPEGDPTGTGDFGAGGLSCQPGGCRTPSRWTPCGFWASLCPHTPHPWAAQHGLQEGRWPRQGRGSQPGGFILCPPRTGWCGAGLRLARDRLSSWLHIRGPGPFPPAPVWEDVGIRLWRRVLLVPRGQARLEPTLPGPRVLPESATCQPPGSPKSVP